MGSSPRSWIWAVEALASNQIEPSLLIDVMKSFPGEISGNDWKNAREMASLRILESLSDLETKKIGAVCYNSQVGFRPLDGCEDVLSRLLFNSSGSDYISSGSEMLKLDFKSFIQKKLSCLPSCNLEKLKAEILKDSHLLPTSLKERSGMQIKNHSDGNTDMPEVRSYCDAPQNSPVRDFLSPERAINATVNQGEASACHQLIVYSAYDPFANAVAKRKQDASCTQKARGLDSDSSYGSKNIDDVFGGIVRHTGRDGSDVPKESWLKTLKEVISSENVDCDSVASKRLKISSSVYVDHFHHKQQASHNVENMTLCTSSEEQGLDMSTDKTKNGEDSAGLRTLGTSRPAVTQKTKSLDGAEEYCEHTFSLIASNSRYAGKDNYSMEHDHAPESSRDDDRYHDNNDDIIVKRSKIINSECTCSQGSLATVDGTKGLICLICRKGGELLICTHDICQRVVHKSCMGVAPTFDARGCFVCPFCSYSQSISEYVASKKKTSSSRKPLVAFICGDEYHRRHSCHMSHSTDQNHSSESDDSDKRVQSSCGNVVTRENKTRSKEITYDKALLPRDSSCGKGKRTIDGRTGAASGEGERRAVIDVASAEKGNAKSSGSSMCCQSSKEQGKQVLVENKKPERENKAVQDCEVHNSDWKDVNIAHMSEQRAGTEEEQDDYCHPDVALPFEPAKPLGSHLEKNSGEKNYKSIACYNS